MRRQHPLLWAVLAVGAAGFLACSAPGRAGEFARSLQIYAGGATDAEGVKLGGWGSGMATQDGTYKTAGDASIKVETGGYYAGARLLFLQPKDISSQMKDPYGFLEFIIRFQPGRPKPQPGSTGGGFPMGDMSNSGNSGGAPVFAGGFPGGPAGGTSGGFPGDGQTLTPDTKKLKVILMCDTGTFVASNFPVTLFPASEEGWFSVALPFVAFKGVVGGQSQSIDKMDSAKIREIRIFGDNKDTFWIGEIRTTTDDEDITVDPLDDLEVSVGEAVEFTVAATGGISPLQYSWDFDLADGIQEDATGSNVIHVFRKASAEVPGRPGELQAKIVTVVVKDLSGAKKQVRRQAQVVVNP